MISLYCISPCVATPFVSRHQDQHRVDLSSYYSKLMEIALHLALKAVESVFISLLYQCVS